MVHFSASSAYLSVLCVKRKERRGTPRNAEKFCNRGGQRSMKVMHTFLTTIIAMLTIAVVSYAQTTPGNLDSTFGTGGIVRTDFAGNIDQANAIAFQPNGQIVAAGSS